MAAAVGAGRLIADLRANAAIEERFKDGVELVTSADLASESFLHRSLMEACPCFGCISEETLSQRDYDSATPTWIVDPIDGTVDYARGHPHVGIAVALARAGVVELGAVHAPFYGETFTAIRGEGALLDGQPIKVSEPASLKRSVVSTGFPHASAELDPLRRRVAHLLEQCQDSRRSASPTVDICWVACGRLDAHTESLAPRDVAAAGLVATEAGARRGSVLAPDGRMLPANSTGGASSSQRRRSTVSSRPCSASDRRRRHGRRTGLPCAGPGH